MNLIKYVKYYSKSRNNKHIKYSLKFATKIQRIIKMNFKEFY